MIKDVQNIVQILEQRANEHPNRIAIISQKEQKTFAEIYQSVQRTAAFIQDNGLKKGDRVLVFVPMSIRLYELLLAIFSSGLTAVFADAWTTKNRLAEITTFLKPKAFWGIPKAHLLRIIHQPIRKIEHHWLPNAGKSFKKRLDEIIIPNSKLPALITLTSGSTGFPKAANRTHSFLLAQHHILQKTLNLKEESIDMPTLPIFVLNNLASGVTTILPDMDFLRAENVQPKRILKQWEDYKVNSVTGSPVFFKKMAEFINQNEIRTHLPEKIFLGGAPVFPSLANQLRKAFPTASITIVYGSTESEPISEIDVDEFILYNQNENVTGLLTGKPIADIKLHIIPITTEPIVFDTDQDLKDSTLSVGEIGEIIVSGAHVLTSYVNQPNEELRNKIKTKESVWHRTGDAGFLDESGNLFLIGRTSTAIVWENRILFSFPVELLLDSFDEIKNAALIIKNNELVLVVQSNVKSQNNRFEQEVAIVKRISSYISGLSKVVWVSEFPMDPRHNSKIDYEKLSQMLK